MSLPELKRLDYEVNKKIDRGKFGYLFGQKKAIKLNHHLDETIGIQLKVPSRPRK